MKEDKLISKSEYSHPHVAGFICAKQYMMYRYQGRKCLLIRFANEADYTVDFFEFQLVQLDSKGTILGEIKSKCENLSFTPGELFVMEKGLVVDDRCVDIRIHVTSAMSGKYLYKVTHGRSISVHYICDDKWKYLKNKQIPKEVSFKKNRLGLVARKKEKHPYKWLRFVAVVAALLALAINVLPYIEYWWYGDMVYTMQNEDPRAPISYTLDNGETKDINTISGVDYVEI